MIPSTVWRWVRDEQAATAVEYAVMLALILMAVISAITTVGNTTSGLWSSNASSINSAMSGS
jgi:pilus assembly protein Flp/PilA